MITRGKGRLAAVAMLICGLVATNLGPLANASTLHVDQALPSAPLTIKAPGTPVRYDAKVMVSLHLGSAATRRTISVYTKPNGHKQTLLARRAVDSHGNLAVTTPALHVLTLVTAVYSGDKAHARTVVNRTIKVRVKLTGHMVKNYGRSGQYALYHQRQTPYVYGKVLPNKYCPHCGTGIVFYLQQLIKGQWVVIITGGAMSPVSRRSDVTGKYPMAHKVGQKFRIDPFYWGDSDSAKSHGPWMYFRFTK